MAMEHCELEGRERETKHDVVEDPSGWEGGASGRVLREVGAAHARLSRTLSRAEPGSRVPNSFKEASYGAKNDFFVTVAQYTWFIVSGEKSKI